MTMRTKVIVSLLAALVLAMLTIIAACAAKPLFEVASLTISPDEVVPGQEVTVSATVGNVGQREGIYSVTLTVDGEIVDTQAVSLSSGSSETVSFVLVKDEVGSYSIGIDGLTDTLRVLKPAEFTVSDLAIAPAEPEVWEEVMVTARVKNVGEVEGIYTATLKIDGVEVETKDVTLAGGVVKTVTFAFVRDVGPSCDIEIDGLTQTVTVREGVLPTLFIGDKWVSKVISEGVEYTMTLEVTGEDVTDGKNCYVMEGSFEPPVEGILSSVSAKFDKATMFTVRLQMSGEYMNVPFVSALTWSYEFPGELPYPLEVGKEFEVVETETTTVKIMGETETETVTDTYTYKVERIEEITVPAGVFRCFKIVKYDKDGTAVSTCWDSDKVKQYDVKSIDHETEEVTELISYSIS